MSFGNNSSATIVSYQDDVQKTGTVNPLDAGHLDVRRRRGPAKKVVGRVDVAARRSKRLRNCLDDILNSNKTKVVVGNQRDGPSALPRNILQARQIR